MSGIFWLASYPKSGNTWVRIFLSNLIQDAQQPTSINNLLRSDIASSRSWLDDVLGFNTADLNADEIDRLRPSVYKWSNVHDELTFHKVHDACVLNSCGQPVLVPDAVRGTLYIVRSPLDVAPSFANHAGCSLDEAIRRMGDPATIFSFAQGKLGPQVRQRLLSWSGHVLSWLDGAGPNLHVVRYEDLHQDAMTAFTGIARFFQLPSDPEVIERAIRFSAFSQLAAQETSTGFTERSAKATRFFRRGQTEGWRDTLNPAQVRQIVDDHAELMERFNYLESAQHWLAMQDAQEMSNE
jgi:hypothetical protein